MAFSYLTYPLDVIKTNRILQTSLAKEGAERIPREILSLQERGNLWNYQINIAIFTFKLMNGLFRGFGATFLYGLIVAKCTHIIEGGSMTGAMIGGVLANPISVLAVRRQCLDCQQYLQTTYNTVQSKSYENMMRDLIKGGNILRPFTLGLIPTMLRNMALITGFQPAMNGFQWAPVSILYGLELLFNFYCILLSHPFEVARVLIQTQDNQGTFGQSFKIMRGVFAVEGLAGLYRGAVPRVIAILPILTSVTLYGDQFYPSFNELQRSQNPPII